METPREQPHNIQALWPPKILRKEGDRMSHEWNPKLPERRPYCAVCREPVTAPPFIASKPKRGATIYAHTTCLKQEMEEKRDARKGNRT